MVNSWCISQIEAGSNMTPLPKNILCECTSKKKLIFKTNRSFPHHTPKMLLWIRLWMSHSRKFLDLFIKWRVARVQGTRNLISVLWSFDFRLWVELPTLCHLAIQFFHFFIFTIIRSKKSPDFSFPFACKHQLTFGIRVVLEGTRSIVASWYSVSFRDDSEEWR